MDPSAVSRGAAVSGFCPRVDMVRKHGLILSVTDFQQVFDLLCTALAGASVSFFFESSVRSIDFLLVRYQLLTTMVVSFVSFRPPSIHPRNTF
jgi:hypothetical protein